MIDEQSPASGHDYALDHSAIEAGIKHQCKFKFAPSQKQFIGLPKYGHHQPQVNQTDGQIFTLSHFQKEAWSPTSVVLGLLCAQCLG